MDQHKKDQGISAGVTLVIMLLSVVLCSWLGYRLPDPPIEEEGMGVAGEVLGEIEGLGNNDMADFPDNAAPAAPASSPDEGYTTGNEPAPVAKATHKDPTPTTQPKPTPTTSNEQAASTSQTQPTQPATNPNASFRGRNKGTGTEGKGAATGSGQAGSVDGTQGASGGTGKGNGPLVSGLGNRKPIGVVPSPPKLTNKQGVVVVTIYVNRQGKVTNAEPGAKGSTIVEKSILQAAKAAALKATFTADPNAPESQRGTITYRFII